MTTNPTPEGIHTHDPEVIDAANELLKILGGNPELALDPMKVMEVMANLTEPQRTGLLIRLSAAQREASRVHQVAVAHQDAPSAVLWGVTSAMLAEACEAITRAIPGLEDTVASRSACEWLAGEAKRYLLLKANATLILPGN